MIIRGEMILPTLEGAGLMGGLFVIGSFPYEGFSQRLCEEPIRVKMHRLQDALAPRTGEGERPLTEAELQKKWIKGRGGRV